MYLGYDSTSIFWQQHRPILGLRSDFTFHQELRWAGSRKHRVAKSMGFAGYRQGLIREQLNVLRF